MARTPRIRLTENDRKEYARLVKNTKTKVKRTIQKYGVDLSSEVELPPLESLQTRKEFNEWKQKAGSFNNRNNLKYQFVKNEFGVVANKSLIAEIQRNTKKAQTIAKQEIKKRKDISQHEKQELLKMAHPNRGGISVPKNFNFGSIRSLSRLKEVSENMEKRSKGEFYSDRMKKMQEVFIRELEESFNSDANWLADKIREMNPDDFLDMYKMYNSFDFRTYYTMRGMDDSAHDVFLKRMERDLIRYQRGDDYSLKDFE